MSRTEDVLLSAVLRGAGVRTAIRYGVGSALFQQRKAEWRFLEEHPNSSRATFKARFPDFKIYRSDPEELETLVKQQQRNMADYELAKAFRKYQQKLGEEDPTSISGEMGRELQAIVNKFSRGKDVKLIEGWRDTYEHVKQRHLATKTGTTIGFPFGVPSLDEVFGGLQAPDLVTILARQGQMKTWLSLYMAANVLIAGGKPMYVSLEMSPPQVALRIHTILSRLLSQTYSQRFDGVFENLALSRGAVDMKKYRKFLIRLRKHVKQDMIVPEIGTSGSIEQMQAKIEEHKPDVLFYDYFGLDMGAGKLDNWMEAEAMSHGFKGIAQQYGIPVVLNAQASRKASDTKEHPQLEHAAYTDSIGRDSDRVISLKLRRGELSAWIAKNRFGRAEFTLRFNTDVDKGILEEIVMPSTRRRGGIMMEEEDD